VLRLDRANWEILIVSAHDMTAILLLKEPINSTLGPSHELLLSIP